LLLLSVALVGVGTVGGACSVGNAGGVAGVADAVFGDVTIVDVIQPLLLSLLPSHMQA